MNSFLTCSPVVSQSGQGQALPLQLGVSPQGHERPPQAELPGTIFTDVTPSSAIDAERQEQYDFTLMWNLKQFF